MDASNPIFDNTEIVANDKLPDPNEEQLDYTRGNTVQDFSLQSL